MSLNFDPKSFDVNRYTGLWYQISEPKDFPYSKGCVFAKALYSVGNAVPNGHVKYSFDGKIFKVKNTCLDQNRKELYSRFAEAYIPNANEPNKLRINFSGTPRSPESDYIVLWTDYKKYAFVGGYGKNLWILSRSAKVPKSDLPKLMQMVLDLGYNPDNVITNAWIFY
jgi:lipocalin